MMTTRLMLMLVVVCLALLSCVVLGAAPTNAPDADALTALGAAFAPLSFTLDCNTNSPGQTNWAWHDRTGGVDDSVPEKNFGWRIKCSNDGQFVTELEIGECNNSNGCALPTELGNLASLEYLLLWGQDTTANGNQGVIDLSSVDFSTMTSLKGFLAQNYLPDDSNYVSHESFSGCASLDTLADVALQDFFVMSLVDMDACGASDFASTFGPKLATWSQLQQLDLHTSKWTVTIPSQISSLTSAWKIMLPIGVSGSIPSSISALTSLQDFGAGDWAWMRFGLSQKPPGIPALPVEVTQLPSIGFFRFIGHFEGDDAIPQEIENWAGLAHFEIAESDITALPWDALMNANLYNLFIISTRLSGPLPDWLVSADLHTRWPNLQTLEVTNNFFTGKHPLLTIDLTQFASLERVETNGNLWACPIPSLDSIPKPSYLQPDAINVDDSICQYPNTWQNVGGSCAWFEAGTDPALIPCWDCNPDDTGRGLYWKTSPQFLCNQCLMHSGQWWQDNAVFHRCTNGVIQTGDESLVKQPVIPEHASALSDLETAFGLSFTLDCGTSVPGKFFDWHAWGGSFSWTLPDLTADEQMIHGWRVGCSGDYNGNYTVTSLEIGQCEGSQNCQLPASIGQLDSLQYLYIWGQHNGNNVDLGGAAMQEQFAKLTQLKGFNIDGGLYNDQNAPELSHSQDFTGCDALQGLANLAGFAAPDQSFVRITTMDLDACGNGMTMLDLGVGGGVWDPLVVSFSHSRWSTAVPATVGAMQHTGFLGLPNGITTLPVEIGQMSLGHLQIGDWVSDPAVADMLNRVDSLPEEFGNLPSGLYLGIQHTLRGPNAIPPAAIPDGLHALMVFNSALTALPWDALRQSAPGMEQFTVVDTRLQGTVPTEWFPSELVNAREISINNNYLFGAFDWDAVPNLPQLSLISVSGNMWAKPIPPNWNRPSGVDGGNDENSGWYAGDCWWYQVNVVPEGRSIINCKDCPNPDSFPTGHPFCSQCTVQDGEIFHALDGNIYQCNNTVVAVYDSFAPEAAEPAGSSQASYKAWCDRRKKALSV